MRELRDLFRRNARTNSQDGEPHNIWEGEYFRELDEYVEEDNARIQTVIRNEGTRPQNDGGLRPYFYLRNEMLSELERLRAIMQNDPDSINSSREEGNRNRTLLYTILDEMDVHVSLVRQLIFIHKKYGMFEISLIDSDVFFRPSTCMSCDRPCANKRQHICIIKDNYSSAGYCLVRGPDFELEQDWIDLALSPIDLLILSKALALENNLIPLHVINQIRNAIQCAYSSTKRLHSYHLRNIMLKEFEQPLESKFIEDAPPQIRNQGGYIALQNELRELFRRARFRRDNAIE